MSSPPHPSILQARGVGIRTRAESLAQRAEQPAQRDQIELVAAAARDALAWLQEPAEADRLERLRSIEESLGVQAKRLDELEDLIPARGSSTDWSHE